MNIKKIVIASAGALAMLSIAGGVFAELVITAPTAVVRPVSQPMVLEVGAAGRVLMRGTVSAVSGTSLTVKSWGGDWLVNVSTATSLMPGNSISQFVVGDFVGVQGTVSTTAAWTIDAKLVRNWTKRQK